MKDFKDNTRERSDKEVVRRLIGYMKPYRYQFLFVVLLMLLGLGIQLLPPFLIGKTVDIIGDSFLSKDEKTRFLIILSVSFLGALAIGNITGYIQNLTLQKIGQKTVANLRDEVFNHIEHLAISQVNQVPVGKLVTRVTNDTNAIGEMYTNVAINLIRHVLHLVAIVFVLFLYNWKLTLYVMAVVPLVVIGTMIFRKFSRASYRRVRANVSEVNAFLSENLSGMKVTQIFNQENKKKKEFKQHSLKLRNSYLREIMVYGIYRPSVYAISMMGILLVLFIGYKEVVMNPLFTAGMLFAFYSYVGDFFEPIQQMAEQFNALQNAFASAEKIFDVLDTKPVIVDEEDAIELENFKGEIEFKNVWFSYIPDLWVLKDVSFKVNPGDTVAFVGATGSGKTTILSLIVRNYDIQKGQILINGKDIKSYKIASLRKQIGQMLQDVFLFTGTIEENITLRDEAITHEQVKSASEYVGANTFIEKLPDQYQHVVLERGNNFSSGQRQLISFARAVVYQPTLMILDEATANIDSETEELIQESLRKMMNISTMLVVAHRLSTIQHSNKIIVMQQGEIVEEGSHQELLKQKGIYYSLYQLQYEDQKTDGSDLELSIKPST